MDRAKSSIIPKISGDGVGRKYNVVKGAVLLAASALTCIIAKVRNQSACRECRRINRRELEHERSQKPAPSRHFAIATCRSRQYRSHQNGNSGHSLCVHVAHPKLDIYLPMRRWPLSRHRVPFTAARSWAATRPIASDAHAGRLKRGYAVVAH